MKIKILTNNLEIEAELNNSNTSKKIYKKLPITSTVNIWGEEIYFSIPISLEQESPTNDLEIGDIGYWPPGNSFCIFFGRTPASINNKPKAASDVTLLGKITKNINLLKDIKDGSKIKIVKK